MEGSGHGLFYRRICSEGLRKFTKDINQNTRYSNPGCAEYESEALTTTLRHPLYQLHFWNFTLEFPGTLIYFALRTFGYVSLG